MYHVLIASDFSARSRSAVLYSLHLMSGRICTFYFYFLPSLKQSPGSGKADPSEKLNCINFTIHQEVNNLRKKVDQFFPGEKFSFRVLEELAGIKEIKDRVSAVVLSDLQDKYTAFNLLSKLILITTAPLLFIPEGTRFSVPRKVLLQMNSQVEIRNNLLAPLKMLYGNHCFSLEIHKHYSTSSKIENRLSDDKILKELFGIYHPVIKTIPERENRIAEYHPDLQKFDLRLIPIAIENLKNERTSNMFANLQDHEVPVLIFPGTEKKESGNFERFRKNKNKTSLQS